MYARNEVGIDAMKPLWRNRIVCLVSPHRRACENQICVISASLEPQSTEPDDKPDEFLKLHFVSVEHLLKLPKPA